MGWAAVSTSTVPALSLTLFTKPAPFNSLHGFSKKIMLPYIGQNVSELSYLRELFKEIVGPLHLYQIWFATSR
jgi:hypothetical protein